MALMKIAGSVLFTFPEVFLVITVNTIQASQANHCGQDLHWRTNYYLPPARPMFTVSSPNNQFLPGECLTLSWKNYINIILSSRVPGSTLDCPRWCCHKNCWSSPRYWQEGIVTLSQCQTFRLTESGISLDTGSIIGMFVICQVLFSLQEIFFVLLIS